MTTRTIITRLTAGLILLTAGAARADLPPDKVAKRIQVVQRGGFVLLGNTFGQDCSAGTPPPIVPMSFMKDAATCGAPLDSSEIIDDSPDILWSSSTESATAVANATITPAEAGTTAALKLPEGAVITDAYLYWAATIDDAQVPPANTVTLERTGKDPWKQVIKADDGFFNPKIPSSTSFVTPANYQKFANVTKWVDAAGDYRVSNAPISTLKGSNNPRTFAGWWMVVLYRTDTGPKQNITLFDTFRYVQPLQPSAVSLTGLKAPAILGKDQLLGVVAFEGDDQTASNDALIFNGNALFNAENPADNFFNGTRTLNGVAVSNSGDLPQFTGKARSLSGLDLDVVDLTGQIKPGDTTFAFAAATETINNNTDRYYIAGYIVSIGTVAPDFITSTKQALDENGGKLLPGDKLKYTIVVKNTGDEDAIDVVLRDPLPAGITYVKGSLTIDGKPRTDDASDDEAEFDATSNTVVARLGEGATAAEGGIIAQQGSRTVAFEVTVLESAAGTTIANQASIRSGGKSIDVKVTDYTDGDPTQPGNQPTTSLVSPPDAVDDIIVRGNGFFCSARPGGDRRGPLGALLCSTLGALVALKRRRTR
jgi:uncharacterized repeat protein (TIGR01451 family)